MPPLMRSPAIIHFNHGLAEVITALMKTGMELTAQGFGDPANHIVSIVPTSDGQDYWLVASDGGIFAFGDATFFGSLPGLALRVNNVVGAVPTRWLQP